MLLPFRTKTQLYSCFFPRREGGASQDGLYSGNCGKEKFESASSNSSAPKFEASFDSAVTAHKPRCTLGMDRTEAAKQAPTDRQLEQKWAPKLSLALLLSPPPTKIHPPANLKVPHNRGSFLHFVQLATDPTKDPPCFPLAVAFSLQNYGGEAKKVA